MGDDEHLRIEEEGFEALQRQYAVSIDRDQVHAGIAARFLLGLYNGASYPFDLTDLRLLGEAQYADCMAVLRMDARLTRREVHTYFDRGGQKFEQLASLWNVPDMLRLQETGDGTPRSSAQRGVLQHGDDVSARLVTTGDAPGYRDVSVTLDCELIGEERKTVGPVRLTLHVNPADGVELMRHVAEVHRFAWRDVSRGPLDRQPGEQRPPWLDKP